MGPWLVSLVGALIVAGGLGVAIQTKWASNVMPKAKNTRYRLSWPVVVVGLVVIAAGLALSVVHTHPGGTTNDNTNIVNVTGGNS